MKIPEKIENMSVWQMVEKMPSGVKEWIIQRAIRSRLQALSRKPNLSEKDVARMFREFDMEKDWVDAVLGERKAYRAFETIGEIIKWRNEPKED